MRSNHILLILALGITVLVSSCSKEGPTGPDGPAGPSFAGTISGHVSLYDEYGNKVLKNLDSAMLIISSNSIVGINPADTVTRPDTTGLYSYTDMSTGQYYILTTAAGYGATTTNNFEFVSGTLNEDIKLSAIPSFALTFASYYNTGSPNDSLVINCTPDEQIRSCVIFVSNSPDTLAGESYTLSYVKAIPANATQVTAIINGQELTDAGFVAGNKVYYTVFSHATSDQSVYEDQSTGKNVYTAVSYPTADSAIVP